MKKFWTIFFAIILTIVVATLLVSLIVANIHHLSFVEQWKEWLTAMKIIKDEAAACIFIR